MRTASNMSESEAKPTRSAQGGVELRGNSIRLKFRYSGVTCRETLYLDNAPLPPTPANAKFARRKAIEIRQKIQTGSFIYADYFPHSPRALSVGNTAPLFFDVSDRWIELHDVKASTKRQYRRRLSTFWRQNLKNVPIDKIRYSDILTALNSGSWTSGKSRNNELSMIKQIFEFARRDKIISENPCEEIARSAYQKPKPDPFDIGEINAILFHLKEHRPEQILNFVQLMFFTGLRTSEGIALQWGNVDFRKSEILIDSAMVYDEESDSTKTSTSRTIKLTDRALEALERQKAHTFLQGGHVFHNPKTDAPWVYAKITDIRGFWELTLKRLGIRYRRPYSMRHSYATLGLMSGAKPGFLAKQLGHSLQMFFSVYATWISSSDDDLEILKLNNATAEIVPEKSLRKNATA